MKRLLLTLLLALSAPLDAQTPTGMLTGRVTSVGVPVAGASVTVSSDQLIGIRSTITGSTGEYAVSGLPPGRYSVTFERSGLQTVTRAADVHLRLTSRADAELKPTEVGESITLTAPTPSILQTPEVATNFEPAIIDLLPIGRSIRERVLLGPGVPAGRAGTALIGGEADWLWLIDGVHTHLSSSRPEPVIEEALDETTMIAAAAPAEYGFFNGGVIAAVTRSGTNTFAGSLRNEIDVDRDNLLQATIGGPAAADRLWFFGAVAHGDGGPADQRRWQGKATAGITESQMLMGSYTRAGDEGVNADRSLWSAHYDAGLGAKATLEALVAKDSEIGRSWLIKSSTFVSSRDAGSHDLSAGYEDSRDTDRGAAFVNDQWTLTQRWSFIAGARHDDGFRPRAGIIYDLYGNGLRRAAATFGRYADEQGNRFDEMTLGYGAQIANNGYLRADAIRRTRDGADDYRAIAFQGNYTLVGLVTAGGNITIANIPDAANVWLIVQPAVGFGRVSVAALQRYRAGDNATDFAVTYAFSTGPLSWFVKADLLDAFQNRDTRFSTGVRF